ncbi:DUF2959 domain-containing protein [Rubellicoccus peritrichatus]|uniref:DUF2959 domain-containing protein n=1 Tax=Rubellicoccus peritrichatus TaxID=3080537 RepID=A0AAQ3L911_9BACT|nr:DUF2959 domain-containing protein [Puniceicoccus sp. CR14]WOO41316.1 DUF2959 domain-containing protein [Puniceicoccus sp. CR14]
MRTPKSAFWTLSVAALLLMGCQSAYYGAMEQFGYHKREILTDRVEEARESQEEAKEQFTSALDQFKSVVNFDGGDLEKQYDKLNSAYERSKDQAEDVSERIADVESVAEALFREWQSELAEYSNRELMRISEERLTETKREYSRLISAMKRAENKMPPVLAALKDQVLFLKHNLNARAVSALKTELNTMENNVATLIADMESAIAEADAFIKQMGQ